MVNEKLVIRQLLAGNIVCTVTDSLAVDWLRTELGSEVVNDALGYVGFKLACSEDEDYFYAAFDDLSIKSDLKLAKKNIQRILNTTQPFLAFMSFIAEANHNDVLPDIEHTFYFGKVLSEIESNKKVANSLISLTENPFFKKAGGRSALSEKLRGVVDVMAAEGVLVSDGSSSLYTFTGKLAYHVKIIEKVFEYQDIELLGAQDDSQGELVI